MAQIDFVPDDYIERKESRRANFFYLGLLAVIVVVIIGAFGVIKVRQRAVANEAKAVDAKLAIVQQAVKQLEQVQIKKQEMMKTALLTAELIEPVPRSLIIAMLTNYMPDGVSLSKIEIVQKVLLTPKLNQYDAAKAKVVAQKTPGQEYVTVLKIEGFAASDIGVADYIANLSNSNMLENVSLVQSQQKSTSGMSYREFKLTAQIRGKFSADSNEVEKIRNYKNEKKA